MKTNYGQNYLDELESTQVGEEIIFRLKRHPIGIFYSLVISTVVLLVMSFLVYIEAPKVLHQQNFHLSMIGLSISLILFSGLLFLFNYIYSVIYYGNRWILTTDSLTQVTKQGVFHKHSSQLSLANLQDVSAEQKGVLNHMFNYGTIKCVTAGESMNFIFHYCPDPSYYARQIVNAKEKFVQIHKERLVQNSTEMSVIPKTNAK